MRLNRILLLSLLIAGFISISAGEEYTSGIQMVDYAQDDSIGVICSPQSECGQNVELYMCGDSVSASTTDIGYGYRYLVDGVIAPEEFSCSQGEHSLWVVDGSSWNSAGDVKVDHIGDMDPHKGDYMIVNMDRASGELRNFLLTDDASNHGKSAPSILVQEHDSIMWSTTHEYSATDGVIGGWLPDQNLRPIIGNDYTTHCGGDEDQKTCKIVNDDFQVMDDVIYDSGWNLDTFTPIHANGRYRPDGEIAVGREPSHYGEDDEGEITQFDASSRQFFICRDGATMDNGYGDETGQVVEVDGDQLYKCSNSDWEEVTECSSGLDHDPDRKIDYPEDDDCDSADHPTESMSMECINRIELQDVDDDEQRVAKYGGNWTGDGCDYATYSGEAPVESPEVFQCYNETEVNNKLNDQGQLTDEQASYCNNEISQSQFENHQYNTTFELDGEEIDVYQMPTVEYYVPRDILPLTRNDREEAAKYVDSSGFDNKKYQTLQQAMVENYDPGSVSENNEPNENCRTVNLGFTSITRCQRTEHHPGSYSSIGMDNLEGYENGDPENYINAWRTANAGVNNDDIISRGDDVTDNTMFSGGFAGICDSEDVEWQYKRSFLNSGWSCTEYTGAETSLTVSFYNVQGAGTSFEGVDAGFQLDWSEITNWRLAHPYAPPDGNISGVEPLQVNGQCWVGERDQRPTNMDHVVNITSTVQTNETTYVIGELPNRSQSAEFNAQRYSCLYGFTQKITDLDLVPHDTITTFRNGDPINVTENSDGEPIYKDGDGNEISEAYITEGSQDAGQIQVETRTIVPTNGYNLDWLNQRSADYQPEEVNDPQGDAGEDSQIGNAQHLPDGKDPWPHHLQQIDFGDQNQEQQIRHPVGVWEDEELN